MRSSKKALFLHIKIVIFCNFIKLIDRLRCRILEVAADETAALFSFCMALYFNVNCQMKTHIYTCCTGKIAA